MNTNAKTTAAEGIELLRRLLAEITYDHNELVLADVEVGPTHEINITASRFDTRKVIGKAGVIISNLQALIECFGRQKGVNLRVHLNEPVVNGGEVQHKEEENWDTTRIERLVSEIVSQLCKHTVYVRISEVHTSATLEIEPDSRELISHCRWIEETLSPICYAIGRANNRKLYVKVLDTAPKAEAGGRH